MKIKRFLYVLLYFFLGISLESYSQEKLIELVQIDTLKSSHSISTKLNEIDLMSGYSMSSFGLSAQNPFLFDPINTLYYGKPFHDELKFNLLRYSSLPHLGFAYSFGSSGFQHAKFQYTQAFQNNWIINVDFTNFQTNGILRNSGMKNQLFDFKLQKQWKNIQSLLTSQFYSRSFEWNGGVVNDSLSLDYPLDLIPVKKEDAKSVIKNVSVDLSTFFNISRSASLKNGIYLINSFDSKNRLYTETGDLASQYASIFVDSFETRDQLQISTQENQIGFFSRKSNWILKLGLNQRFWNYRNGLVYRDTLELGINESFLWNSKSMSLNQKFDFVFLGNGSSWKNQLKISKSMRNFEFKSNWNLENSWPDLFQRHYFSNNTNYQLSTYDLQLKNKIDFQVIWHKNRHDISGQATHLFMRNPYIFDGNSWSNAIYNQIQAFKFQVFAKLIWKDFEFVPHYAITLLPSTISIYPTHHLKVRSTFQKGILKDKKLKAIIGLEPQFIGGYSPVVIYSNLDLLALTGSMSVQSGYLDLAVLGGFELNAFKFFARAENLGYFWNNRVLQVVSGYPIPPLQIRLGITWDFWN